MIRQMFLFGVLVPTLITILVFIGFLICWFKFNIRERVLKSRFYKKHFNKDPRPESVEIAGNSIVFNRESSSHWSDHGGPSRHPENDQTNLNDKQTKLLPSSEMADDAMSICSLEDALCKGPSSCTDKKKSKVTSSINYVLNPNWQQFGKQDHMASEPLINSGQPNGVIQMTYNFPDLDQSKREQTSSDIPWSFAEIRQLKTSGDYECDNYGHFVSREEIRRLDGYHGDDSHLSLIPDRNCAETNHVAPSIGPVWSGKSESRLPPKSLHGSRKTDPVHGPGFHHITSAQDCNNSLLKNNFPLERAPALLTGI